MRIDKLLQVSGFIKRRTLANEACKRGLIKVNGTPVKPTREIQVGDEVDLDLPRRELSFVLLQAVTRPSIPKKDRSLYFDVRKDVSKAPSHLDDWDDDD